MEQRQDEGREESIFETHFDAHATREGKHEQNKSRRGEAGYTWLYRASALHGTLRVLFTILAIALGAGLFAWYAHAGNDASPDSLFGLIYASIGTLLLLLAAVLYTVRRRSRRKRVLGSLRVSLGWHMCFALVGLAFLAMHSFGELNARSGTYALYGMIALVISGLIGRVLDRVVPRLMAGEVHRALTDQGGDRIETISQQLQALVVHNTQTIQGFAVPGRQLSLADPSLLPLPPDGSAIWRNQTMHSPWDLAYISLDSTPQELEKETGQFRLVPDKKSEFLRPGALMPGSQERMNELEEVRRAMGRELFYRYVTRYWRFLHILLALLTLGLLVWHIAFALQLLLTAMRQ